MFSTKVRFQYTMSDETYVETAYFMYKYIDCFT